MDYSIIGIIGSLILIAGAAWPEHPSEKPIKSVKNWLFAGGGVLMFFYSLLGFLANGNPFFLFLQAYIVVATILMMLNTSDKFDAVVLSSLGVLFIGWSLLMFEDYSTAIFILGLVGVGFGYVFDAGTLRRNLSLFVGSVFIATFGYIKQDWIYFALNIVFALFSAYYVALYLTTHRKQKRGQ